MLTQEAVGALVGLGAHGPKEWADMGEAQRAAASDAFLKKHPQLLESLETALFQIGMATGMSRGTLANVLNVAIPTLVRTVGTLSAQLDSVHRPQNASTHSPPSQ